MIEYEVIIRYKIKFVHTFFIKINDFIIGKMIKL